MSEGTDHADRLREAYQRLTDARDAVAEHGEDHLRAVRDAHTEATDLLDRYEETATGTGDFQSFVEFQESFVQLVEGLPDDLLARDAFEAANEHLDQRRLDEGDFERARELLGPATEYTALLSERERAEERYETVEREAERRLRDLEDRIDHLTRLQRLGDADLDAPVENLRDPVENYNETVREAWQEFRREASAREVFRAVEASQAYPLAAFPSPPPDIREYVETYDAGTESIPTLLTYADYSASKLDHYVDDPGALRTRVATHRTYLERLDADPLTVAWPPASASHLRHRAGELVSVVARFADDDAIAAARRLRRLPDQVDYERLREAALARDELDADERERLTSGEVESDLATAREERDRIATALDEYAV